MKNKFEFPVRVYYEDTDAGGIVYYANYLKFAERGRSEWLRILDIENTKMEKEHGLFFVVKSCAMDFIAPAKLDDALVVETEVTKLGAAAIDMMQRIKKDGDCLVEIVVRIVCVDQQMKATRLPQDIREKMKG